MPKNQPTSFREKLFKHRFLNTAIFVAIFAVVAGLVLYNAKAATEPVIITGGKSSRVPVLYVYPESQSVSIKNNYTFSVWENSQTIPVNSFQANLTYDVNKFDFVSFDSSSSPFTVVAQATGSNGVIKISLGSYTKLTSTQLIGNVTLKPKVSSGSSLVNFTTGSMLVSYDTNTDILQAVSGGNYTFTP